MASPPVAGEVATGAVVATGDSVATGASVAMGGMVGRGGKVATGAEVAMGTAVGVGVGMSELHEQAMITIPAMAPIKTIQNFLRISIGTLLSRKMTVWESPGCGSKLGGTPSFLRLHRRNSHRIKYVFRVIKV
jgi:hypothetical protein